MLSSHPYLHLICVKEAFHTQGIGSNLMIYFENNASVYASTKYFLIVDDFNANAINSYDKLSD